MKVCVVGACGGIGQTLSLLVKQNPRVSDLALYDVSDDTLHGVLHVTFTLSV